MSRGDFEFFGNIQTVRIRGSRPSGACKRPSTVYRVPCFDSTEEITEWVRPCFLSASARIVQRATAKPNLEKYLALQLPSGCDADSKYSTTFLRSTRTRFAWCRFILRRCFSIPARHLDPILTTIRFALFAKTNLATSKWIHAFRRG